MATPHNIKRRIMGFGGAVVLLFPLVKKALNALWIIGTPSDLETLWRMMSSIDLSFWDIVPIVLGVALILFAVSDRLWRILPGSNDDVDRWSFIELRDKAESFGWDFGSESLHIKDLADGVRQAASDNIFVVWGRPNRNQFENLTRQELLVPIPASHWRDHWLDYYGWSKATDNFTTQSYETGFANSRGYVDLHVDRKAALRWLKRDALAYRGLSQMDD